MENKASKNFEDFLNNAKNQAENYSMPKPEEIQAPRFTALSLGEQMSNFEDDLRADPNRYCQVKSLRRFLICPSERPIPDCIDSYSSNL